MAAAAAAVLQSEADIRIRPINGFIGAEIEGVDLRHPLSPARFKACLLYTSDAADD